MAHIANRANNKLYFSAIIVKIFFNKKVSPHRQPGEQEGYISLKIYTWSTFASELFFSKTFNILQSLKKTFSNFFFDQRNFFCQETDLSSFICQTKSYFLQSFWDRFWCQVRIFSGSSQTITLIHRYKKNKRIDEAIKSVIVETANNVTSSLLDFSLIMMMVTMMVMMMMMMMILVANGPDPRQDRSFESHLIWAQIATEVFKT